MCRSQFKIHAKVWSVNVRASALAHTCIGQSPENVSHCQGRSAYLLQQPEVINILAAAASAAAAAAAAAAVAEAAVAAAAAAASPAAAAVAAAAAAAAASRWHAKL